MCNILAKPNMMRPVVLKTSLPLTVAKQLKNIFQLRYFVFINLRCLNWSGIRSK